MQCDQHTVETVAAQHEDGQDVQRPQKLTERGMVPDQRDFQTTAFKEHGTYVSYTVWIDLQVN